MNSEATKRLLNEADELEKRAKQKRALAQKKIALARKAEQEAERKALSELKHRLGGFVLSMSGSEGVGGRIASHLRMTFFDDLKTLHDSDQRERLMSAFEKHYQAAQASVKHQEMRPS